MKTLDKIRSMNESYTIHEMTDPKFNEFGRILKEYDLTEVENYSSKNIEVPNEGSYYVPSNSSLEGYDIIQEIRADIFAGLPVQAGISAGHNSTFSAFEFHQGSEVCITFSDIIMVLGDRKHLVNEIFPAYEQAELFFMPAGSIIELYSNTLHYSPCEVYKSGFKNIVVLIKGTNETLEKDFKRSNELIVKKNKFQAVHESRKDKIEQGIKVGISGKLIKINSI